MQAIRQSINSSNEAASPPPQPVQAATVDHTPAPDLLLGNDSPGLTVTTDPVDRESADLMRALDAVVIDHNVSRDTSQTHPSPAQSTIAHDDQISSDGVELLLPDEAPDLYPEDEEQMRLALALSVADMDH